MEVQDRSKEKLISVQSLQKVFVKEALAKFRTLEKNALIQYVHAEIAQAKRWEESGLLFSQKKVSGPLNYRDATPFIPRCTIRLWVLIGNTVFMALPPGITSVVLLLIDTQVAVHEGREPMNEIFLHPFVIA